MKTKITSVMILAILFATHLFAQDRTYVSATNFEISDNLDLRAVASIFGESENLEDFERQLNDPRIKISNLDLNNDHCVDYLRVIESVDYKTHLIIIQSVLGRYTFQDVATIEIEKNRHNQIQIQVVGNAYLYGTNYIFEPIYIYNPIIYSTFWVNQYTPYSSAWYWNNYPIYYYAWSPCPIYSYQNNVNFYVNYNNQYNYVTYRNSRRAAAMYQNRRSNYYENQYPNRSYTSRNKTTKNRYEMVQVNNLKNTRTRSEVAYNNSRNHSTRGIDNAMPTNYIENVGPTKTGTRQHNVEKNVLPRQLTTKRNSYSDTNTQRSANNISATRTQTPRVTVNESQISTREKVATPQSNTVRTNGEGKSRR